MNKQKLITYLEGHIKECRPGGCVTLFDSLPYSVGCDAGLSIVLDMINNGCFDDEAAPTVDAEDEEPDTVRDVYATGRDV